MKKVWVALSLSLGGLLLVLALALVIFHDWKLAPELRVPSASKSDSNSITHSPSSQDESWVEGDFSSALTPLQVNDGQQEIVGRVLAADQQVLAQVEVRLYAVPRSHLNLREEATSRWEELSSIFGQPKVTKTNSKGEFRFAQIGSGTYSLVAWSRRQGVKATDPFELTEESSRYETEIQIFPWVSIQGRVLNEQSQVVPKAQLSLQFEQPLNDRSEFGWISSSALLEILTVSRTFNTESASDGSFKFSKLYSGFYSLKAQAEGFGTVVLDQIPPGLDGFKVILKEEVTFKVKVVDENSRPIEGANIQFSLISQTEEDPAAIALYQVPQNSQGTEIFKSNSEGFCILSNLVEGDYRLEVHASGYQSLFLPLVSLRSGSRPQDNEITVELEAGGLIRGQVVDDQGQPLNLIGIEAFKLPGGELYLDKSSSSSKEPSLNSSSSSVEITPRKLGFENFRATTDSAGQFEFNQLDEGSYWLEAWGEGYERKLVGQVEVGTLDLKIELGTYLDFEVQVVDQQTKEPVTTATAFLIPQAYKGSYSLSLTQENGGHELRFKLARFSEGSYRSKQIGKGEHQLFIEAPMYKSLEVGPLLISSEDSETRQQTVELEPSGFVQGELKDQKSPVSQRMKISLFKWIGTSEDSEGKLVDAQRFTYSDTDGAYKLGIQNQGVYKLLVEGAGYARKLTESFEITEDLHPLESFDIELESSIPFEGIVLNENGTVLPEAKLYLRKMDLSSPAEGVKKQAKTENSNSRYEGQFSTRSRADGKFFFSKASRGEWQLIAHAKGHLSKLTEPFWLEPNSQQVLEIVLESEKVISGEITDDQGFGLELADIEAKLPTQTQVKDYWYSESAKSDIRGFFVLNRLANTKYNLKVSADGFATTTLYGVEAGERDLRIPLEPLLDIKGIVLGAFSGDPVQHFTLRLEYSLADQLSSAQLKKLLKGKKFETEDGRFDLSGLPPGDYIAHVSAENHLEAEPVKFQIPLESEREGELELFLEEKGALYGMVQDGRGNGISGARIYALKQVQEPTRGRIRYVPISRPPGVKTDWGSGRATSSEFGSFALKGLPDGIYRLAVRHDEFVGRDVGEFTLQEGLATSRSQNIKLFMASGTTLLISLRNDRKVESGSLRMSLSSRSSSRSASSPIPLFRSKEAKLNPQGRFEIGGLGKGEYRLSVRYRLISDSSPVYFRRTIMIRESDGEKGITISL